MRDYRRRCHVFGFGLVGFGLGFDLFVIVVVEVVGWTNGCVNECMNGFWIRF